MRVNREKKISLLRENIAKGNEQGVHLLCFSGME